MCFLSRDVSLFKNLVGKPLDSGREIFIIPHAGAAQSR